ncbi:HrgA protein [Hydrogenophaga sp. BPS33]|uniref:HrgA protein n=1 Tax=Hydrogenophaga sp. BPS33 TaxID=2651974 RepID=UPI00131F8B47|nr:HrgA protein [Hydrogenophaga sp. BPS33]QHE84811.1 HrgA protein [Hydrogenophaga sp. BPS33]
MLNLKVLSLRDAVLQFLQSHPGQEFKSRELADGLKLAFPVRFAEKDPAQIAAEIGAGGPQWLVKYPSLHRSEEAPRRYWWSSEASSIELADPIPVPPVVEAPAQSEHALYPLLATFLISRHRKIFPKRIDEKKSSNTQGKEGNKWLHPDMVGLEELASGWSYEMKTLSAKSGAPQAKLWSFEVKVDVPRGKVREYYFQAVSNSSWANYGYLVAVNIKDDAMTELRLLNELHGIGVIRLNPDNPADDSAIEIPARERLEVDWGTCNRIATENKDFLRFIQLTAHFYDTKATSPKEWDIPLDIAAQV